ncbi:hypothetical protein GALMADRAFT_245555 [Galerina marginata CBS 339.88]|uniref:Uncharacterized protein n=1 Tax=Galerina marginata (strain CBS 339.88) TaxID=685588 RepID=A0A067T7Q5_GALM3|nr:hypothetical protein GALMADRAFT_245555 [Galerina marginata CBS 339.88]
MFPDKEVLELFSKCHCLVDCALMNIPYDDGLSYEQEQRTDVVPFLQKLSINEGGSQMECGRPGPLSNLFGHSARKHG